MNLQMNGVKKFNKLVILSILFKNEIILRIFIYYYFKYIFTMLQLCVQYNKLQLL